MKYYHITHLVFLFFLFGCSTMSKNVPYVIYLNNNLEEVIGPKSGFCIYDYMSNIVAVADKEEEHPANYQIFLPPKKMMKGMYVKGFDRCFLFSKGRGIAIFQDIPEWDRKYENGFRSVSNDMVEELICDHFYKSQDGERLNPKIKKGRKHYLYVNNELRIVIFNTTDKDKDIFVYLPVNSLNYKKRGRMSLVL